MHDIYALVYVVLLRLIFRFLSNVSDFTKTHANLQQIILVSADTMTEGLSNVSMNFNLSMTGIEQSN